MRKFTIYNLQFTIIALFFTFYIVHFTFAQTVFALESTPSSDIKMKLEELKKEIASKAAKLKGEIDRKLTNKAYIGKVKQKSEASLTLASASGPKIVTINQDTILPKKKIKEEDYIASLGDVDETGVLTAKKIVLLPSPEEPKTYLWGQIIAVSDNLTTLKSKEGKSIAVSLDSSVKINQFVILAGNMGKNDIFKASFVYVIPQGGILKSKKIATQSATPSAKKN